MSFHLWTEGECHYSLWAFIFELKESVIIVCELSSLNRGRVLFFLFEQRESVVIVCELSSLNRGRVLFFLFEQRESVISLWACLFEQRERCFSPLWTEGVSLVCEWSCLKRPKRDGVFLLEKKGSAVVSCVHFYWTEGEECHYYELACLNRSRMPWLGISVWTGRQWHYYLCVLSVWTCEKHCPGKILPKLHHQRYKLIRLDSMTTLSQQAGYLLGKTKTSHCNNSCSWDLNTQKVKMKFFLN